MNKKKVKIDNLVFDGDNCVNNASDFLLKIKGEPRRTSNFKLVEYNSQLHAHEGSGFDSWITLNTFFVITILLSFLKMENVLFL